MTAGSSSSSRSDAPRPSIWQAGWVNSLGRFIVLVLVFAFFALAVENGKFYTPRNLESILRQSAVYATAALGMTLVIVAGGIDLSVGSIIALAVVVVAWVLNLSAPGATADAGQQAGYLIHQWPTLLPLLAVAAGVAVATLAGAVNGMLIVGLGLVPFIVTLGTLGIWRGLAKGITGQRDIYPPESTWLSDIMDPTLIPFLDWLSGERPTAPRGIEWLVLPLGVWILIVAAVAAALLLRYTRFGRHVFAIGSNESTARLCGVPVERTKVIVYLLAGFFAGLAGLMQFSYEGGNGYPTTALGYELHVIAAVVLGGGSLLGGEGSVLGSVVGALMITVLKMGGEQMDWPKWVQEAVIGGIIIAAATLDRIRHHGTH
jgi:ribose transport system permease protein/erythritol transport system permease protein